MTGRQFAAVCAVTLSALALIGADRSTAPVRADVINGPYARILAQSTDLGPARTGRVQVTAALRGAEEPVRLTNWADSHGLAVRWRPGDDWAVIEGGPSSVASAFGLAVHDYRIRRGPHPGRVFYASPQQPGVPAPARAEVSGLGRILSYVPTREALPVLPRDVPNGGLAPSQLLEAYNATPLVDESITGRGQTVAVFAFDGFDQKDMDTYADMFELPRFAPQVVGGMPERHAGEANMDLQVIHGIAPEAKLVLVNARSTADNEGDSAFVKLARLMESTDRQFPGAVWSMSIGWGCDRFFTAADFAPVRAALSAAQRRGTTVFDATGDLAGLECKAGQRWSDPPSPDDIGIDAVASLPEMTAVGGTELSTGGDGEWHDERSWYDVPLTQGTAGGASVLFPRPPWQAIDYARGLPNRRLVPDVAAVADPFTGVQIVYHQEVRVGGGTSQAAPIWAGMAVLMNQKLVSRGGKPLGALNPLLYRVAVSSAFPGFRDISRGGNAITKSSTSGYDMVTGLGSPNVDNLVKSILILRAES